MRLVLVNGVVRTPEEATVSVYDRGFLYGDSVFETIRTYSGKPFALGEHMARLARSAERVLMKLPVGADVISREIERAVELAGNRESYIRVMLTRGTGPMGLDIDLAENPSRIVYVEPLVPPSAEVYAAGIEVILMRTERATDATSAAGAKVANYLTSILALREARRRGGAEALIVDGRGRVLEGTTSNVFLVKAGRLATPPEESGILAGITRAHLLSVAELLQVPVDVRDIGESEVFEADELFISSSIREVLAVVRVEGRAIGHGRPGPVTTRIHQAFRAHAARG
jgi:branched-chain amino acid aminotransferase